MWFSLWICLDTAINYYNTVVACLILTSSTYPQHVCSTVLTHTVHLPGLALICCSYSTDSELWTYLYQFCLQNRTWILLAMSVTLTTHVSPPEHNHFISTTPAEVSFGHIGSHWEHGCETAENDTCIFKFFMMWLTITNMNKFTVWCTNTYKHTDTTRIQHTNVGLSQPHPNKCQSFNMSTG